MSKHNCFPFTDYKIKLEYSYVSESNYFNYVITLPRTRERLIETSLLLPTRIIIRLLQISGIFFDGNQ